MDGSSSRYGLRLWYLYQLDNSLLGCSGELSFVWCLFVTAALKYKTELTTTKYFGIQTC